MSEMKQRFKAIIFDLDGTLIDIPDHNIFNRLLAETLENLSVRVPSRKELKELWVSGKNYVDILRGWGVGNIDEFWRIFDHKDLTARKDLIRRGLIRPFDDVGVLERLKERFKLGLVSNTIEEIVMLEIEAFDLKKYFSKIVTLGTVAQQFAKPEPDGIIWCLEGLDVPPNSALTIGDQHTDIIAGKRAGSTTALLIRRRDQQSADADLVFKTLYELEDYIVGI
ncbi:MAG: HAD family hydrolase [Candidatus Hodarchaeota archaeon]